MFQTLYGEDRKRGRKGTQEVAWPELFQTELLKRKRKSVKTDYGPDFDEGRDICQGQSSVVPGRSEVVQPEGSGFVGIELGHFLRSNKLQLFLVAVVGSSSQRPPSDPVNKLPASYRETLPLSNQTDKEQLAHVFGRDLVEDQKQKL